MEQRMASKTANGGETAEAREEAVEGVLLDITSAAVKKLIARGKERGYVTYDEVNAAMPQETVSSEFIEDTLSSLSEAGINVVEAEESEEGETKAAKAEGEGEEKEEEESGGNVDEESLGRTDDPVRMYLREMGSVELLSREGEIAIAKRIEAGRDMMIGGLCESPLTFKAIVAWHDAVKEGRMLLRDVIDLEATNNADNPEGTPPEPEEFEEGEEGENVGLSLSALEEKLKPEVLANFEAIQTIFTKLHQALLEAHGPLHLRRGADRPVREDLREVPHRAGGVLVEKVHLHNNRIEELVEQLKALNRKLNTLDGQVLRMALAQKVRREEFLEHWIGAELDPAWIDRVAS
jgi:RNA polymerase primary sigma factor